jgi:hypothetical protein
MEFLQLQFSKWKYIESNPNWKLILLYEMKIIKKNKILMFSKKCA